MNEHDLLDAIGKTEETMLEASEKRHIPWKALLTAAACLLVILSSALIALHPRIAPGPNVPTTLPGQNIMMGLPGQIISTEHISWLQSSDFYAVESDLNGSIPGHYFYDSQFFFQMSVEARVLNVLPDTYQYPGDHSNATKYRILRMELLDAICAENMPSEFYYLLPADISTDLSQFDSLILTIAQIGCENVMMRNTDQRRFEAFRFLFSSGSFEPHRGAVIACTDEKPDPRLWQLEGWRDWEGWPDTLSDPDRYSSYPGKRDRRVPEIKAAIVQGVRDYQQKNYFLQPNAVIRNSQLNWAEAQAVLELVAPFENGFYSVSYWTNPRNVIYQRFANGFETNAYISINLDTKEITAANTFSDTDLRTLPDLEPYVASAGSIAPPDPRNSDRDPYAFCGVKGSYEKHGEHVFGIVTIYWGYPSVDESEPYVDCIVRKIRTSSYLLVYPNGKATEVEDYDALKALIEAHTG